MRRPDRERELAPVWAKPQGFLDRKDVGSVVRAARWSAAESVGNAHGVCRTHQLGDLVDGEPSNRGGLVGWLCGAGNGVAAKGECNDPCRHVLVHASDSLDGDADAGLFTHFTMHARLERFGEFEHATGWLPLAAVAALDGEDPAVVTEHGTDTTAAES